MKPAPFDYVAPETVDEALAVLAEHGDDATVIAGGQSLVPMLAMRLVRTSVLVDIGRIEGLAGISIDQDRLVLGAMTRHASIGAHPLVMEHAPLLSLATPHIGHEAIRSRGTIGGALSHADPAAEYPAVIMALDAELTIANRSGPRTVPAREFFAGFWTTDLAHGEVLVSLAIRRWENGSGFGFAEIARRHGDFGMAGAAVGVTLDQAGLVVRCAIALLGVASTPVRMGAAEQAVIGHSRDGVHRLDVSELVSAELDPPADLHASSRYRQRLAGHVTTVALRDALHRATPTVSAQTEERT